MLGYGRTNEPVKYLLTASNSCGVKVALLGSMAEEATVAFLQLLGGSDLGHRIFVSHKLELLK